MTRSALLFALVLAATPAAAQEDDKGEGLSLMEEGARLFMRGIMSEMEPALRELEGMADEIEPAVRSFVIEMGPALRDLFEKVDDWSKYEAPEILPNGDIIMRRKTPLEEGDPLQDVEPGEEIDL